MLEFYKVCLALFFLKVFAFVVFYGSDFLTIVHQKLLLRKSGDLNNAATHRERSRFLRRTSQPHGKRAIGGDSSGRWYCIERNT